MSIHIIIKSIVALLDIRLSSTKNIFLSATIILPNYIYVCKVISQL